MSRVPHVSVLIVLVAVVALAGCKTLRLDSTPGTRAGSASASTHAFADFELSDSLEEIWTYNAEAGFGPVTPLLYGEYILVANRRGEIHAVDAESGKRIGTKKFGDAINGTPAVRHEKLFVPVDVGGRKGIKAWDLSTGTRMYDLQTPAVESDILILNDRIVYVDIASSVYCRVGDSGMELWTVQLDATVPIVASPILVGHDRIAIVDTKGKGVVLSTDSGETIGTFVVDGAVFSGLTFNGTDLFVPTVNGKLYSVSIDDLTSRLLFSAGDKQVQLTSVAADGHSVVVGGSDGIVRALNSQTGKLKWETDVGHPVAAAPLVVGQAVYVGTLGRTLLSLRLHDGSEFGRFILKGRVKSPLIARAGELYVLSEPRFMYRFGYVPGDEAN